MSNRTETVVGVLLVSALLTGWPIWLGVWFWNATDNPGHTSWNETTEIYGGNGGY